MGKCYILWSLMASYYRILWICQSPRSAQPYWEIKVTLQKAEFDPELKTCLCPVQTGIVFHVATLPHLNNEQLGCGEEEIKVLPFLIVMFCSGVTPPWVDSNGVILLSITASFTLADHFSSALVYHSVQCSMFSPFDFWPQSGSGRIEMVW